MPIMLTLIAITETARVFYRPAATTINPAHNMFGRHSQPMRAHGKGPWAASD